MYLSNEVLKIYFGQGAVKTLEFKVGGRFDTVRLRSGESVEPVPATCVALGTVLALVLPATDVAFGIGAGGVLGLGWAVRLALAAGCAVQVKHTDVFCCQD